MDSWCEEIDYEDGIQGEGIDKRIKYRAKR